MSKPKIYVHGSYIGTTGFNNHTRDFFREMSKHFQTKVRNFTVGSSWNQYSENCHDGEKYLNDIDKSILYKQVLWTSKDERADFPIYPSPEKEFKADLNIVLNETNHHLFYDSYVGPKIAFNVWETTLLPTGYFEKLKQYDELWVPSKWQRDCTIEQGYDPEKIKVVPEGVDVNTFFPETVDPLDEYKDGRFKFLLFGRWDYRKSTKEIIETFLKTFSPEEQVDLVVSIDNPWGDKMDGYTTTEERLKAYGLTDPRIKIVHFPSREDYIKFLKTGHVFVSCARAEGWNLPLIEAMACGTPSIYSNCSAQLEFAQGRGIPVNIVGTKKATENNYGRFYISDMPGDYYEPDFNHLSEMMRLSYEKYDSFKKSALVESEDLRNEFSWERIGEIGSDAIMNFYNKITSEEYLKNKKKNEIIISYLNGAKVEIKGDESEEYKIEFINKKTGENIYTTTIKNNMWTTASPKYYVPWIIKVNEEIIDEFDLSGKTVLVSMESKAIGDTVAWAPYVVEFSKKYKCKVIFSSFNNNWFEGLDAYKDITFVKPGQSVVCDAIYRLGWFRKDNTWGDTDKNPNQVNLIPLQQTASDILGLKFEEVNHGLNLPKKSNPRKKEYVVFGPNGTSGCKEWAYENWVMLANMIMDLGYDVITLTKNDFFIKGTTNIKNKSFDEVANYLHHAKAFIGLGSGLSWFNWALGKHTYMINGFARPGHEFTTNTTRIYNDNVCVFCWNDEVFTFDPGDWDWCPVYKGTSKQHICQKSITPIQVFNKLKI